MEENPIYEEAKDFILKFKRTFFMRFGVEPFVQFNLDNPFVGRLSMVDLATAVDIALNKHMYFDGNYATIMAKTRKRPIVYYRHAFCKMALELRFQCTQIAKYLDMNHSSVIHSSKLVTNLLQIKDQEMILVMNNVKDCISEYLNNQPYGITVQENYGFGSQSQSVLSPVLSAQQDKG